MPFDCGCAVDDTMCLMLYFSHSSLISELMFSLPLSVTRADGQPK